MTDKPDDEPQEKKTVIDEDWKAEVQAEKEDLQREQEAGETAESTADAGPTEPAADAGPTPPLPPPTFEVLVSSLGMQAMISMGLTPSPASGKPEGDLDQAKHLVDTLAMLEEKTEGNRTPEETALLGNFLHELRMAYVAVRQTQAAS